MKPQFHLPLSTSPEASSFTIIENAVQFCANQNADLVASISVPRRVNRLHSEAAVGDDTFQAERFARGAGAQLVEHLRDRAGRASVDVRLVRFEAEATSACQTPAELARAYDLSVLENSEIARPVIENMLFESGRPVLLLSPEDFYGRIDIVALAFDGSATIARAASGAYPLMQSATKAIVISVLDGAQLRLLLHSSTAPNSHVQMASGAPRSWQLTARRLLLRRCRILHLFLNLLGQSGVVLRSHQN